MRFASFLKNDDYKEQAELYEKKRRHSRREADRCIAVLNNQPHPVFNWSVGGVLLQADERLFAMNDQIGLTMKFKIGETVRTVEQTAKIIRKSSGKVALQFLPLTGAHREMQHVLNDCITNQFVESQLA